MSQDVKLDVFYPYPPERVWQVLTDRHALAAWMMDNDFEPKLGHKFQFRSQPLPGLTTTIQCKVVELEEPTRLVYTWQESPTAEPSLVIWTLTTVPGGTQLRLKHHQCSYTTAPVASNRSGAISAECNSEGTTSFHENFGLFRSEIFPRTPGLQITVYHSNFTVYHSNLQGRTQSNASDIAAILEVPVSQTFPWNYVLKQKLLSVLAQDEPIPREYSSPN